MRRFITFLAVSGLLLTWVGAVHPGDDDGRALVNKAIVAAGGEEKLVKFQSATMKEKGIYYGMGDGLPYTGVYSMKWPDQFRMEIKGVFTMCVNGDKGWTKSDKGVEDMTKEAFDNQLSGLKAGWMTSLLPLTDKAFAIKTLDGAKVGDTQANVVEVSRKDYPTVKLYFDKKTDLVIKSEYKTKSPEQKFKEVLAEVYYSEFKTVDGCKMPHRVVLKHAGKLFVEADVTEMKAVKLDDKVFAKPAE